MENTTTAQTTDTTVPQPGDPRHGYAIVTGVVAELIAAVEPDQLDAPTPCPDFAVRDLLEHLVLNQRNLAGLGRGEAYDFGGSATEAWGEQFADASHQVMDAWTDSAKLGRMYEVPWGTMPGAALIGSYTAEQAVHAWDVAQAIGRTIEIEDAVLQPSLDGLKMGLPAEGRTDEIPFGPVVVPTSPDASVLEHLAGWSGRQV